MRHHALILAGALLLPALARAESGMQMQDHESVDMELPAPKDSPIRITINPEARVGAIMAGDLPPPSRCGEPTNLSVKVINQGFVTARLEAELVGDVPAGATLDFHPEPLKGVPQEIAQLQLILTKPGWSDITIAFSAHGETSDFGRLNQVHFLLRCRLEFGATGSPN